MAVVISMERKRGAGRPREHDLTQTPLGRWVLENFKGDFLDIAKELGIDISALEKVLSGEMNPGEDMMGRFLAEVEKRVCPKVARLAGLKPDTFIKYANGTLVPSSTFAVKIKYFTQKQTPANSLDLDALIDYRRKNAA